MYMHDPTRMGTCWVAVCIVSEQLTRLSSVGVFATSRARHFPFGVCQRVISPALALALST